jgi:hypothetical protein
MKYVKTENGIYQFKNNENICKKDNELFEIQRFFQPVDHINYKLLGKITAEADTIEELCDIYVSVYENPLDNDFFWAHTYTPLEVKNFYNRYIPKEVYGAIWTDKGLIYVAKMNEKGELELL